MDLLKTSELLNNKRMIRYSYVKLLVTLTITSILTACGQFKVASNESSVSNRDTEPSDSESGGGWSGGGDLVIAQMKHLSYSIREEHSELGISEPFTIDDVKNRVFSESEQLKFIKTPFINAKEEVIFKSFNVTKINLNRDNLRDCKQKLRRALYETNNINLYNLTQIIPNDIMYSLHYYNQEKLSDCKIDSLLYENNISTQIENSSSQILNSDFIFKNSILELAQNIENWGSKVTPQFFVNLISYILPFNKESFEPNWPTFKNRFDTAIQKLQIEIDSNQTNHFKMDQNFGYLIGKAFPENHQLKLTIQNPEFLSKLGLSEFILHETLWQMALNDSEYFLSYLISSSIKNEGPDCSDKLSLYYLMEAKNMESPKIDISDEYEKYFYQCLSFKTDFTKRSGGLRVSLKEVLNQSLPKLLTPIELHNKLDSLDLNPYPVSEFPIGMPIHAPIDPLSRLNFKPNL